MSESKVSFKKKVALLQIMQSIKRFDHMQIPPRQRELMLRHGHTISKCFNVSERFVPLQLYSTDCTKRMDRENKRRKQLM